MNADELSEYEYKFFSDVAGSFNNCMKEFVLYQMGHPETVAKVQERERLAEEAEAKLRTELNAQLENIICPFCGSKQSVGFGTERVCCGHGDNRDKTYIICHTCHAAMSVWGSGTAGKIAAVRKWNNAMCGIYDREGGVY